MHLPPRDVLATVLVGIALVAYAAWLIGGFGMLDQVSAVAVVVFMMGIAASLSAVVPGFAELLGGSRMYLVVASAVGVAAFGAGLWAMMAEEGVALALLVLTTVALWAMSTARHVADYNAAHPTA